jgi:hypothetical protein
MSGLVLSSLTLKRGFAFLTKVPVLVFAALLFAALDARASSILYDQPAGAGSDLSHNSSPTNAFGVGQRIADDFVLGAAASISDIHWWGFQLVGAQDTNDFQFTFYDNNAGAPGAVLHTSGATNLVITPTTVGQFDANFYSADLISAFSASAATTYWVSIFNQKTDLGWFWIEASAPGNGGRIGTVAGAPWSGTTDDMAFQLTGTATGAAVPEPATLALLGSGLVGLIARHRRSRLR